jgi:hypothetical protein
MPLTAIGEDAAVKRRRTITLGSPLEEDKVLAHVFSFVGRGDHLYTGGVSRKWRGDYMQHCTKTSTSKCDKKLVTRLRNTLVSTKRLWYAKNHGLCVKDLGLDLSTSRYARMFETNCSEPCEVITILRLWGVQWGHELCAAAASSAQLSFLQWLHRYDCPWDEEFLLYAASRGGSVAMLKWLQKVTAPWLANVLLVMLDKAATFGQSGAAEWLRQQDAAWPAAFAYEYWSADAGPDSRCWSLPLVQWAMASGSGWLYWRCEDYAATNYTQQWQQQAAAVLDWAHANGCPCTCGHVQQQEQEETL